ncbi:MAG: hypothetical protein MUF62_02900 [Chitinophagaceae bacterium]|jgi:hypothetical protein|nr:hypothetical protein [Chitinophagaceae bacterium]
MPATANYPRWQAPGSCVQNVGFAWQKIGLFFCMQMPDLTSQNILTIMPQFGQLAVSKYHLIQENENGSPELIFVALATDAAVLVEYEDSEKTRLWKRKTDTFFELVETLSEAHADAYDRYRALVDDKALPDWAQEEHADDEDLWDEDDDLPYKN